MRRALIGALIAFVALSATASETFDIALRGGRVVDPETGLDGIRDVGVRGDRIAAVSPKPLAGRRIIEVRGLVVAPGFIDLHQHQQDAQTYQLKALDGVTTALRARDGCTRHRPVHGRETRQDPDQLRRHRKSRGGPDGSMGFAHASQHGWT
jgi:predicted amidohydrolase YtcJ